jgi:polyisoprenoid-binding protein YceI
MSWKIDSSKSAIEFGVRKLNLYTVRGRFTDFTGTLHAEEADPTRSSISVQIDAASVDTKNRDRDDHLKAPAFLNVKKYPHILFQSNKVELIDASRGRISGTLTIRDVTNTVVLDVERIDQASGTNGNTSVSFKGRTTISRMQSGVKWGWALGKLIIGDPIQIDITLVAVKSV